MQRSYRLPKMERVTIEQSKELFGANFIGIDELKFLFERMGISCTDINIPKIEYSLSELQECSNDDYILILGLPEVCGKPLSIHSFRTNFGFNPDVSEPCFYNQDWYLKEDFIYKTLESRWYLVKKEVLNESHKVQPEVLINRGVVFPSALLCVYVFFAYYFLRHEILWCHNFVWCDDTDHNGDRIYVGKYCDIDGVNKNGFSIHRHLALRDCYAAVNFKN